jgi:rhodanese-related sulfurtransferase
VTRDTVSLPGKAYRSQQQDLEYSVQHDHHIADMTDYESRAETYGFATKREIKEALSKPETVIMDVRTAEEIATDGRVHTENPWVHVTDCTAEDCASLRASPEEFVKYKNVGIVIHCKSGRRAATAKKIMTEKGYTNVLNAGGYCDIVELVD